MVGSAVKANLFLLLLFMLQQPVIAQIEIGKVYQTSLGIDGPVIGTGALTMGLSIMLQKKHQVVSKAAIEHLDPERLWKVDRWVINNYSHKAHQASNVLLFSSYALPLGFLAEQRSRDEFGLVGLMTLEALLLNNGIGNLTKHLTRRVRPYVYNPNVPLSEKQKGNSDLSFFSGHTSNVSCMYYMTATMYNDFYPQSKGRPYVWATAAIVPAIQGYLRVRAGKHFVTDVVVGYLAGALVGILIPTIHR